MFAIIALFCLTFFRRAIKKTRSQALSQTDKRKAKFRAGIYAFCGTVIVLSILFLTIDNLSRGKISEVISRFTFYGEAAGLIAFGIAWLTVSLTIPIITGEERITLSPFRDSEEKPVSDDKYGTMRERQKV